MLTDMRRITSSLLYVALLWGTACSASLQAQSNAAPPISDAVVRIPSHGASATVIYTEAGRTLLLGCGHAYRGADYNKPMTVDIPCINPGPKKNVGVTLLKVDYEADLSLVQLNDGPVECVAPVADGSDRPGSVLLSVGFDNMQLPATVRPAHPLHSTGTITFTRERPWHGRSGGGLLDKASRKLFGVCSGYETSGQRRGLYVSHATILQFLSNQNAKPQAWPATPISLPYCSPKD